MHTYKYNTYVYIYIYIYTQTNKQEKEVMTPSLAARREVIMQSLCY